VEKLIVEGRSPVLILSVKRSKQRKKFLLQQMGSLVSWSVTAATATVSTTPVSAVATAATSVSSAVTAATAVSASAASTAASSIGASFLLVGFAGHVVLGVNFCFERCFCWFEFAVFADV
jgi:hypothetical protein